MKRDIKLLPLSRRDEDFSADLRSNSSWILPQALALIAEETIIKTDASRQFLASETALANNNLSGLGSDWTYGLYHHLITHPRGDILATSQIATLEYCALVPLYLSAFKKYKDIPYSKWNKHSLANIIDKDCLELMLYQVDTEFTKDQLLEFLNIAATIKSGSKAGQKRTSNQMTTINKIGDSDFDALPRLVKVTLLQTWCAHPSLRNKYMILDSDNWDNMPGPLVGVEVAFTKNVPWK